MAISLLYASGKKSRPSPPHFVLQCMIMGPTVFYVMCDAIGAAKDTKRCTRRERSGQGYVHLLSCSSTLGDQMVAQNFNYERALGVLDCVTQKQGVPSSRDAAEE